MDKESLIMGLIFSAALGFAIFGILREFRPVLLAAINFTGIALIIVVCALCFACLLILIFLFTGNQASTGNQLAIEFMRQRRINKLNQLILKQQLEQARQDLIDYQEPEIIRNSNYMTDYFL